MKFRFSILFLAAAATVASQDIEESYDNITQCVDVIPQGANPEDVFMPSW